MHTPVSGPATCQRLPLIGPSDGRVLMLLLLPPTPPLLVLLLPKCSLGVGRVGTPKAPDTDRRQSEPRREPNIGAKRQGTMCHFLGLFLTPPRNKSVHVNVMSSQRLVVSAYSKKTCSNNNNGDKSRPCTQHGTYINSTTSHPYFEN